MTDGEELTEPQVPFRKRRPVMFSCLVAAAAGSLVVSIPVVYFIVVFVRVFVLAPSTIRDLTVDERLMLVKECRELDANWPGGDYLHPSDGVLPAFILSLKPLGVSKESDWTGQHHWILIKTSGGFSREGYLVVVREDVPWFVPDEEVGVKPLGDGVFTFKGGGS